MNQGGKARLPLLALGLDSEDLGCGGVHLRGLVRSPETGLVYRDTAVSVRGPAVADPEQAFAGSWDETGQLLPDEERPGAQGIPLAGDEAVRVVLITIPRAIAAVMGSILTGHLIPKYIDRLVMIVGLLILVASSILMSFASPTMPIWVLTLAYILVACSNASIQTSSADIILGAVPPDRVGAVSAMKPAAGMTGYTLGPTIFVLLLGDAKSC